MELIGFADVWPRAHRELVFTVSLSSSYEHGGSDSGEYEVEGDQTDDVITVKTISGGPVRLDYILTTSETPRPMPSLTDNSFPTPDYVYFPHSRLCV